MDCRFHLFLFQGATMLAVGELTVTVFAAGDHSHANSRANLPNSSEYETGEIIKFLLTKAGYTKSLDWQARIDKMLHCSPESRIVRCTGYKPFGVAMRVKPQAHSTVDQLITLLIPEGSGYSAENLFTQLKNNEKSVSRNWRKEMKDKVVEPLKISIPMAAIPAPAPVVTTKVEEESEPEQEQDERPKFHNLKGVSKSTDKLRFVLEQINKIAETNKFVRNKEDFINTLRGACGWTGFLFRICSRVMSELMDKGYVYEKIGDHHKIIGYALTPTGEAFIGLKQEPVKAMPPPNFEWLLVSSRDKIQDLADAAARLNNNLSMKQKLREDIANLQQQIVKLEEEDQQIAKVLEQNQDAYNLLERLLSLVKPLPMKGVQP